MATKKLMQVTPGHDVVPGGFVMDHPMQIAGDILAAPATPQVCEGCRHWQRKPKTSFGVCYRFHDILVESRDGVSAAPFTPVTPELASCHCWEQKS